MTTREFLIAELKRLGVHISELPYFTPELIIPTKSNHKRIDEIIEELNIEGRLITREEWNSAKV